MSILTQPSLPTPLPLSETPVKMAKASLRSAENFALTPADQGEAMRAVMHEFRLSLKEFSRELGKDERQIARQLDGTERPQLEAVWAVPRFVPVLLIALANRAPGVQVDTVIHIRRTA